MSYILDTSCPAHTILRGNSYYLNLRVPKAHQQLHGQIIRSKLSNDRDQAELIADHVVGILKKELNASHPLFALCSNNQALDQCGRCCGLHGCPLVVHMLANYQFNK